MNNWLVSIESDTNGYPVVTLISDDDFIIRKLTQGKYLYGTRNAENKIYDIGGFWCRKIGKCLFYCGKKRL